MKTISVFPLAASTDWVDDLENALDASMQTQRAIRGEFYPLFAFSPMTEPANPDAWEPLGYLPQDLFLISIERSWDKKILRALAQLEREGMAVAHATAAAAPLVIIDEAGLIADVYDQMAAAELTVFTKTGDDVDSMSFFFIRGEAAVRAFDRELRFFSRPDVG
ncbi:MAG: hypothetical protein ABI992_11075 [Chthoniobacterales bacterium]